mmetsp:Transcript_26625/g.66918  ORF Transcript_26625/g.66918 Transcript_26625/m.66918 type:complete len:422 (+) Transcript_26625:188-1453(+)
MSDGRPAGCCWPAEGGGGGGGGAQSSLFEEAEEPGAGQGGGHLSLGHAREKVKYVAVRVEVHSVLLAPVLADDVCAFFRNSSILVCEYVRESISKAGIKCELDFLNEVLEHACLECTHARLRWKDFRICRRHNVRAWRQALVHKPGDGAVPDDVGAPAHVHREISLGAECLHNRLGIFVHLWVIQLTRHVFNQLFEQFSIAGSQSSVDVKNDCVGAWVHNIEHERAFTAVLLSHHAHGVRAGRARILAQHEGHPAIAVCLAHAHERPGQAKLTQDVHFNRLVLQGLVHNETVRELRTQCLYIRVAYHHIVCPVICFAFLVRYFLLLLIFVAENRRLTRSLDCVFRKQWWELNNALWRGVAHSDVHLADHLQAAAALHVQQQHSGAAGHVAVHLQLVRPDKRLPVRLAPQREHHLPHRPPHD